MRNYLPEPQPGARFGRLTYIKRDLDAEELIRNQIKDNPPRKRTPRKQALCKCDCGNTKTVDLQNLRKGLINSCGCLQSKNYVGQKINSLVVTALDTSCITAGGGIHKRYICRCEK